MDGETGDGEAAEEDVERGPAGPGPGATLLVGPLDRVVQESNDHRQAGGGVEGAQGLETAVGPGYAGGRAGIGREAVAHHPAQHLRRHVGQIAGESQDARAAGRGQRRFETGQGTTAGAAVGDGPPAGEARVGRLAGHQHDLVGHFFQPPRQHLRQRALGGRQQRLVPAHAPALATHQQRSQDRFLHSHPGPIHVAAAGSSSERTVGGSSSKREETGERQNVMSKTLEGKKIAILVENGFEQVELTSPLEALKNAGATAHIVSPQDKEVKGWDETDWGKTFDVDVKLGDADASDYDGLLLPGGVMNPDKLRANTDATDFIREFFVDGKPVAAICHGPWTLIDAGVAQGRRMTSYHSIKADLQNAGAVWVDEEVVVDQGLVTSRNPDDLPAFNDKMVEEFCEGKHKLQAVSA
jgi:protease I